MNYTEEEIQALPQTSQVFDRPAMNFNDHDWRQEGYMITDICSPSRIDCHHVGIPLPNGRMIIKTEGGYSIVDEMTRV